MCREVPSWSPPLWAASYAVRRSPASCFSSPAFFWSRSASHRLPDVRCLKPWIAPGKLMFPCGQCDACRGNRRRIWTHRILLESIQHAENAFVTLTYDDAHLPPSGSLQPDDLQKWIKRLRTHYAPLRFRFFAVGEYGDTTWRPHYHAALFGFPTCQLGPIKQGTCQCRSCFAVRETWGFGHVLVGTLEQRSAQYIAGYTTKKMTNKRDERLNSRHPEFARMSLRPGVGATAIPDVASVMMQFGLEKKLEDVPVALRHGSVELPLGRYLRRLLRAQVGLPENAPASVMEALRSGLLPVFDAAEKALPYARGEIRRTVIANAIADENEQFGRNTAARFRKKRKL